MFLFFLKRRRKIAADIRKRKPVVERISLRRKTLDGLSSNDRQSIAGRNYTRARRTIEDG
jgi:hypothetical protein